MSGRYKIAVKRKRNKKVVLRDSVPDVVCDSITFNSFCVNFPKFDTKVLTNKDLCQGLYNGDLGTCLK